MSRPKRAKSFRDAQGRSVDAGRIELPTGETLVEGWLSQIGDAAQGFRDEPRWNQEIDLSTVHGHHTPEETYRYMLGVPPRRQFTVRHLPVPRLREAGYLCVLSARKRYHVSIVAPVDDEDVQLHQIWWRNQHRVRLCDIARLASEGET